MCGRIGGALWIPARSDERIRAEAIDRAGHVIVAGPAVSNDPEETFDEVGVSCEVGHPQGPCRSARSPDVAAGERLARNPLLCVSKETTLGRHVGGRRRGPPISRDGHGATQARELQAALEEPSLDILFALYFAAGDE
jgi:hypothetical protein